MISLKNKILYQDWIKDVPEEDLVFVPDSGIITVFFERKLNYKLENSTISIFTAKSKYRNQIPLICNHLNYFIKFYDPENRYMTALLKVKTILDERETILSKESFIELLYSHIITKPILKEVFDLVKLNNIRSIEDDEKTVKYGKEASFTDKHNTILYRMAMCTNLMIPLILHYIHRFASINKKTFLIDEYYNPLFNICGKGINLKEKLLNYILNETEKSMKRDRLIWEQKALRGDKDFVSFAEEKLQNIVSNIIPKLDYNEDSHNIALIRSTISSDFRNFTREKYGLYPEEISDVKDSDDSLSQQDKMEMTVSRIDVSNVIICNVNKKTVIEKLKDALKIDIDEKEKNFYKKHYKPTEFQIEMIKLYFVKYFNGFIEMSSLTADEFTTLVVIMKYKMQGEGYKYLQHMIIGHMLDKNPTKTMRSHKFVDKIEQSSTYKRLVKKKYKKLLKLKGDRIILDKLSLLLKTKFSFIDYNNKKALGQQIEIDDNIVCDEFLIFLSNI